MFDMSAYGTDECAPLEEDGMSFARFISGVMVGEFKKLRFRVNSLPEFKGDSPDTKRQIFRATRIIGASDTLA